MLDVRFIVEHPHVIKDDLKKRFKADRIWLVDELLEDYNTLKKFKKEVDDLRHKRNVLSEEVNKLKKQKKDPKKQLKEVKDIPGKIKEVEEKITLLEEKMKEKQRQIPNITHESVPQGKDETENLEVRKIGKVQEKKYEVKNHAQLIEEYQLADFDAGRLVAGEGFNYLLGKMALLDLALQRYGIDFLLKQKFTVVVPPLLIREEAMKGVVNMTDFKDTIYKVENEDKFLVGTAENALVPLFKDKVFKAKDLPVKVTAVTPCFRRELGAHGVDTKGLFRMHQFNKVEQVVFCDPQDSYILLEEIQKISEEFFKSLGLSIRTIAICSGDLGSKQAKQYDIEAWFPRQNAYKEVTSASNCTDYQSRPLNIKYEKQGIREYVHILNNTMVATSRAMVAILENFQEKDGSVTIPEVLQPYTGFKKIP